MPPAAVWAGLEPVVQSEASQKEKSKCHILRNISGNIGIGDLIYKAEIEIQMQRTNLWIPRWKGAEGMSWEIRIDMYTLLLLCIK